MAKYMLSIFSDEKSWETFSPEETGQVMKEYNALTQEMKDTGAFLSGEGLAPTATAKTVSSKDGRNVAIDGPYAETKEQLGGFYLLECKDEAGAIEWAGKIVDVQGGHGFIEVRPVMEYPES